MTPLQKRGKRLFLILASLLILEKLAGIGFAVSSGLNELNWLKSVIGPLGFAVAVAFLWQGDVWLRWLVGLVCLLTGAPLMLVSGRAVMELANATPPEATGISMRLAGLPFGLLPLYGGFFVVAGLLFLFSPSLRAFLRYQQKEAAEDERRLQEMCELTEVDAIQMMFPTEPEWAAVEDSVLIELVREYVGEQSCATSALHELSQRKHRELAELCEFLLDEASVDTLLKQAALELLLEKDLVRGLDQSRGLVDRCDTGMLSILVDSLLSEFQTDLRDIAVRHTTTQKLRTRLLSGEDKEIGAAELFYEKFGRTDQQADP